MNSAIFYFHKYSFVIFIILCHVILSDLSEEFPPCMRRIVHPTGLLYLDECNLTNYQDYNLYQIILSEYIRPNDIIIELNSGYGLELLRYAQLLNMSGNIIVIEPSSELFQYLGLTLQKNNHYERSLLLNSMISFNYFDIFNMSNMLLHFCVSESVGCKNLNRFSLTHIYDLMNKQCIQFIAFNSNYHDRDKQSRNLQEFLISGHRLLQNCKPNIFIDFILPRDSESVLNYLNYAGYDSIYWIIKLEFDNLNVIDVSHIYILAVGQNRSTDILNRIYNDIEIYKYIQGKYFINQYIDINRFKNISSKSILLNWIAICVDGSITPCYEYNHTEILRNDDIYNVFVKKYIPIFNPPFPLLRTLVQTTVQLSDLLDEQIMYKRNNISKYYDDLLDKSYKYDLHQLIITWEQNVSSQSIYGISKTYCIIWLTELLNHIVIFDDSVELDQQINELLDLNNEMMNLTNSCVMFLSKQYFIVRNVITRERIVDLSKWAIQDKSSNIFDSFIVKPFIFNYQQNRCFEPIWCEHTFEMQRRIQSWQFPNDPRSYLGESKLSNRSCESSKYLIYEPSSNAHGIGSMIEQIASTFRYALCLNRILILLPFHESNTTIKWRMPGCRGNWFECYFQKIHGCSNYLTYEEIMSSPISEYGRGMDRYPLLNSRIVRLQGYPTHGKCILCGSGWDGNTDIFDGLLVNELSSFIPHNDQKIAIEVDKSTAHLKHFNSMLSAIKLPWTSQFIRYLFRPKSWFSNILQSIVKNGLIGPKGNQTVTFIPHPFVSMHIRYGMKAYEEILHPLDRYMSAMSTKLAHIKNIFLSTETEDIIHRLKNDYPDYNFYHIDYPRLEFLDLSLRMSEELQVNQDFVAEFLYSIANLYVSSEADGFIGTLTSNWCTMIQQLEHTRGDGGYDYLSIDKGSAFSTCF